MASLFDVLPRTAALADDGRLGVGGCALADVAAEFGTPVFVIDEQGLRDTAREYLDAFRARHARTHVHFASKACPCAPVLRVLAQEGLGCDVASAGELAIALAAGFDPAELLLHGNAKRDEDVAAALGAGVGTIVIDGPDDVDRLERMAPARQAVLLRINPAVPGVTHAAMDTGSAESKFGVSLDAAPALLERIAAVPGLELRGLHVHIGSQLLDLDGFGRAAEAIATLGRFPVYDLGGGLGIAYTPDERAPSVADYADATVTALRTFLDAGAELIVEPGRSVVGRSAVTVYSVVTVKRQARTHVAVDGGMADNLEPMLYGQRFAPAILDRDRPPETCELVGHHCESGDVLARGVALATPEVGDLLVMPATGAYCYSLLNNYNGTRKPPVVFARGGDARLAVRREEYRDLLSRDVL
ncbi:MAG TPA: diaminopimelate decarboxylase [Solirubrobacteraceae bacterium]|nr:diaminopimelate decarboxylase [Solirubrobacteraceae bacterium]